MVLIKFPFVFLLEIFAISSSFHKNRFGSKKYYSFVKSPSTYIRDVYTKRTRFSNMFQAKSRFKRVKKLAEDAAGKPFEIETRVL